MKSMFSPMELTTQIKNNQEKKADFIHPCSGMFVMNDGNKMKIYVENTPEGVDENLNLSSNALRQLLQRSDTPQKFSKKLMRQSPETLAVIINLWLEERADKKLMIRTMEGKARAVLSENYRRVENEHVALVTIRSLAKVPCGVIRSTAITDLRMYIRISTPEFQVETCFGPLEFGAVVTNSEVGAGGISVHTMAYLPDRDIAFLIAENKLVSKFISEIISDKSNAQSRMDAVFSGVMSDEAMKDVVLKFQQAHDDVITMTKPDFMKAMRKAFPGLPCGRVIELLPSSKQLSRQDLVLAIAEHAQEINDFDEIFNVEIWAGKILEMPRDAWREVANAE